MVSNPNEYYKNMGRFKNMFLDIVYDETKNLEYNLDKIHNDLENVSKKWIHDEEISDDVAEVLDEFIQRIVSAAADANNINCQFDELDNNTWGNWDDLD